MENVDISNNPSSHATDDNVFGNSHFDPTVHFFANLKPSNFVLISVVPQISSMKMIHRAYQTKNSPKNEEDLAKMHQTYLFIAYPHPTNLLPDRT
jgi:hypothetical protein